MNAIHYKILGVKADTPSDEIKNAYHSAAKKNHPDSYPHEERQKQHLIMMKINEAYMSIITNKNDKFIKRTTESSKTQNNDEKFDEKTVLQEVGHLKDPAYVYYKLGFDFYNKGQVTFHKGFKQKGIVDFKTYFAAKDDAKHGPSSKEILNRAVDAIQYFEKSYAYFLEVINKHSHSPWCEDAKSKLKDLEKLNEVYTKICLNMSDKM